MSRTYPITDVSAHDGNLAHLKSAIARNVMRELGGDAAMVHILKISHVIFLVCAFYGRPADRVRVSSIFRMTIAQISRKLGVPTSPALVQEAGEALVMLRNHAEVFGFCADPERPTQNVICPCTDTDDNWSCWFPPYPTAGPYHPPSQDPTN